MPVRERQAGCLRSQAQELKRPPSRFWMVASALNDERDHHPLPRRRENADDAYNHEFAGRAA